MLLNCWPADGDSGNRTPNARFWHLADMARDVTEVRLAPEADMLEPV